MIHILRKLNIRNIPKKTERNTNKNPHRAKAKQTSSRGAFCLEQIKLRLRIRTYTRYICFARKEKSILHTRFLPGTLFTTTRHFLSLALFLAHLPSPLCPRGARRANFVLQKSQWRKTRSGLKQVPYYLTQCSATGNT